MDWGDSYEEVVRRQDWEYLDYRQQMRLYRLYMAGEGSPVPYPTAPRPRDTDYTDDEAALRVREQEQKLWASLRKGHEIQGGEGHQRSAESEIKRLMEPRVAGLIETGFQPTFVDGQNLLRPLKEMDLRALTQEERKLIHQLQDGLIDLRELQRQEGVTADGIIGPRTMAALQNIARRREGDTPAKPQLLPIPCEAACDFVVRGKHHPTRCQSMEPGHTVHHASMAGWTHSWAGQRNARFVLKGPPPVRSETVNGYMLEQKYGGTITRPESFVRMDDPKPMTIQEYAERFNKLRLSLSPDVRFGNLGWYAVVDLAEGGQWQYWRPFRVWAERTGTARLLREVEALERLYQADNPETFSVADLGVSREKAVPSSDELTEQLYQDEVEDHREELSDWDAAYKRIESTTPKSTDIVLFENKEST